MSPYDSTHAPPHSAKELSTTTDRTEVLTTSNEQEATLCSLVLSSTGISHHYHQSDQNLTLSVDTNDFSEANNQLKAYFHENKNWPPKPVSPTDGFTPTLQPPTLLLIGALVLLYTITGPWAEHSFWFSKGAGDAEAILGNNEYFRLVTALTLHADTVHLLGNCLFGGFLFHFLCKLTGNGLGLFAMIISATVGNYINVALHGNNHLFVGFSTAVFAIIGMLAMINRRYNTNTRYLRILPYMAGAALLAMIGSSGERTDLGAHFFGLCSGLLSGWILSQKALLELRKSLIFQTILFFFSITIIVIAWKLAFL